MKPGLQLVGEIERALSQDIRDSQASFMSIRHGLEGAVAELADIAQRFAALPQEFSDDGRLASAFSRIRASAEDIAGIQKRSQKDGEALANLLVLNHAIGTSIERLTQTIDVIAVLATNAKIVTAQITSQTIEVANFAGAIDGLARTAVKTVRDYALEHDALTRVLEDTGALRLHFMKENATRFGTVIGDVERALSLCQSSETHIASQISELGRSMQRLSDEVGRVVGALDIGDMTRNQAAIVIDALKAVTHEAVVQEMALFQAAQLEQSSHEFDGAIGHARTKLKILTGETRILVAVGESIRSNLEGPGSTQNRIEENLAESAMIVAAFRNNRRLVNDNIAKTGTTLGHLIEQMNAVRWIESEVRLVALNATLKCQKLGDEGRALSVIAQELRGYANETVEQMKILEKSLETLGAASASFLEASAAEDLSGIDSLKQWSDEAIGLLRASSQQLGEELSGLCRAGAGVAGRLDDSLRAFQNLSGLGDGMKTAAERLRELGGDTREDELLLDQEWMDNTLSAPVTEGVLLDDFG